MEAVRRRLGTWVALAVLALLAVAVPGYAASWFDDVPTGHVFHDDVTAIAAADITRGCNPPANTRFCPDDLVTRGQMAAFLSRTLGLPRSATTFSDSRGHLFEDDIATLAGAGITRGCNPPDNTRFCPDDFVTRGQMAAFLDRALGLDDGHVWFRDAYGSVFEDNIAALAGAGITRGCNPPVNSRFCPGEFVTRGQMAAFLNRAQSPSPRPAVTFDGPVMGVHMHALWNHYDDATRARVLDELADAGVRSIRVDIGWASLEEHCSGCISDWYLERIERTVAQARARNIDVLGVLWRTPSWAGDHGPVAPPRDAAEYGRVAGWLADHFEGRVTAWEIWNEPNQDSYFRGGTSDYVELVQAAAPAIHAADPGADVVLAGPADNDALWVADVLARGAAGLVDVVGIHSYPTPSDDPPTLDDPEGDRGRFAHVDTVIEVVNTHTPGTPVWITEYGWSTHATAPDAPAWHRGVTEEEQAQYAGESLLVLQQRWPQVERAYWFRAMDLDTGKLHLDNYGLFDSDGRPKPAVAALRRVLTGS